MSDGFDLDYSLFARAAATLGAVVKDDPDQFMEKQARGFVKELFPITPPAAGGALTGAAAVQAAERRIDRDLRGLFVPVQLKGKRTINHLFGDFSPDGIGNQPPYVVETVERYPDVEAVYRYRAGRKAAMSRKAISRGQRAAYYVSDTKLAAFATKLKKRIGWLAAGWGAAARSLKAPVPRHAARHPSAPGQEAKVVPRGNALRITISNRVGYAGGNQALRRRLQHALNAQAGKMERQLPHVIRAAAKEAGFKTAA